MKVLRSVVFGFVVLIGANRFLDLEVRVEKIKVLFESLRSGA